MSDTQLSGTKRWNHSNKSVFDIGYHLVWCSKYRRKVLTDGKDVRLKELFQEKALSMNWNIVYMEVMPDHVHLFVKAEPTDSPHWIVQQLKGYTSKLMREEFPDLKKRLPSLWTRSYFCVSVGHILAGFVEEYIEGQKNK